MAPGRRAARRADRERRPAEGLAGDLPRAARLEDAGSSPPDPRADLGIGGPARARSPARGLSSGDLFGWREPQLPGRAGPRDRRGGRALAGGRRADRPRLRPGAAPGRAARARPATRSAVVHARARRRRRARSRSSSAASTAGSTGGPDGLAFVTDRELFGTVRVRRPKAMRRVVPRDILERLTPGDLVVHIDHGVARYERMLRRGDEPGEERDYLELALRRRRPDLRPGRADQPRSRATAGGERPTLSQARRHRVAADEAAGPEGGRRTSPRSSSSCTRRATDARGHAFGADTPWQARDGGERSRTRRRVDQLRAVAEVKLDMEARPADGPARRRRRRLRQDRGRAPRRVQGDPGRQAGRGPRPDDRPRRPAPPDVRPAVRGVPDARSGCCRGSSRRREQETDDRRASRTARSTSSSGPIGCCRKDVRFRDLGLVVVDEEQRFGVAAKERLKQLAPRGRRPDAVRDADPADAQPRPRRASATCQRHRDAAGGSAADPDARRRGVGRARPRRDPARARPRRPGVLRPQPGRDDRGPGRAAAPAAARRPVRRRPRPDGRGRSSRR